MISNKDRGGYFKREFRLNEDIAYTPYIDAYGTGTIF